VRWGSAEGIIAVSVDLSNIPFTPTVTSHYIYLLPRRSVSPARLTHSSCRMLLKHIPRDSVVKRTRPTRAYTFSRLPPLSGDRSIPPSTNRPAHTQTPQSCICLYIRLGRREVEKKFSLIVGRLFRD